MDGGSLADPFAYNRGMMALRFVIKSSQTTHATLAPHAPISPLVARALSLYARFPYHHPLVMTVTSHMIRICVL